MSTTLIGTTPADTTHTRSDAASALRADTHFTTGREPARYAAWENAHAFAPSPGRDEMAGERFAMILPPPNITGSLHMGHAYEHTISDAIIRHQRMLGAETLWLPGTDHAGIATQALLERQLAAEGTSRTELGREKFLARAHAWRATTGETISTQMRSMGSSSDWARATYTFDPGPRLATHTAFTRLYREGLIYRAERDTSWCTGCRTTLSDIETEDTDAGAACTRCGSPIETRSTPQWWLATSRLAAPAREALTSGALRIERADHAEAYLRWLDDMRDWCLSRQLWWGHRIPIWYDADCNPHSFAPGEHIPSGWTQDEDTLDTWFSSGLWPLATLGWPNQTADLSRYYPNDLLITGYDLLFFWAIRMTMLCTHFTGTPPFKTLYLHGMIRDEHGKKMSKSFGNTIDPADFIDEYGPDALRLALARRARPGADIPFGRSDLIGAQATCKKLWSIARLAQHHNINLEPAAHGRPPHILDRWLLSRLEQTRETATAAYAGLDLAGASDALARFLHEDLSGLYLEARKGALRSDPDARATFAAALRDLLLMLHPLTPFLTEELTEALTGATAGAPLDAHSWPAPAPHRLDTDADSEAENLRALLHHARAHRTTHGIPAGTPLPADATGLATHTELFNLARLTPQLTWPDGSTSTYRTRAATLTLANQAASTTTEASSSQKRLDRARADAARLSARMADPAFTSNAPEHIQTETAARLRQAQATISDLEQAARR